MYDYLRLWALLLIAFHLLAPYLPIEHVWGAGGFPTISLPLRLLLAAAAAPFLSPRVGEAVWQRAYCSWRALRSRLSATAVFAIAGLLAVPVFWLGRLRHLRWGDAYIFANAISHPEARLTYTWQAPFDVYLHAKAWALANSLWGWDVQAVYALISCLAGGLFVFVVLSAARGVCADAVSGATLAGLTLTAGAMQLFFGYVESYTVIPVGIALFLWLGLRLLKGGEKLWPVAAVLAVTLGFSPSSLPLSLPLLYLAWVYRKQGFGPGRVALELGAPMLIVAAGIVALFTIGGHGLDTLVGADAPGGGDHRWLVPLLHTGSRWEHYTMFSWAHLRDFLNEQALVAPLALPVALGGLVLYRRKLDRRDPALRFLALAGAAYLLLTFVWNPDYGGRRDWDLFAPAAVPLAALAAYMLSRDVSGRERARSLALVVAVQIVHLAPWIWFNAQLWPWD